MTDFLQVLWYPVVNDTVGGWSIANVDKPMSQLDSRSGAEFEIGDFLTEEIARHVCNLHNATLPTRDGMCACCGKRPSEGPGEMAVCGPCDRELQDEINSPDVAAERLNGEQTT